jgi:hypothetical protein
MHKRHLSCGSGVVEFRQHRNLSRTPRGRSQSVRLAGLLIGAVISLAMPSLAGAVMPNEQASNSREARDDAIRGIPFQELQPTVQQKLGRVLAKPTIYRRLPTRVIDCDPDMYLFLVRHPEVVVNIWDLMGVTNVKLQRTGEYTLRASDGAGTITDLEMVYGSRDRHVIYAEGYYEGPLSGKRLTGRCVLLLRSSYEQGGEEKSVKVANQLDVFLQLDNVGADLLARTLQPVVGRTADHNFLESAGFVAQLSQAAEANPPGVQRLAERLELVDPAVRDQFAGVAAVAGERALIRRESLGGARADLIATGTAPATPGYALPRPVLLESNALGPVPTQRRGMELRR